MSKPLAKGQWTTEQVWAWYNGPYTNMVPLIELLREEYGRPLINNEWLNRLSDNNYKEIFPLFYLEKIGSYSWGLM